MGPIATRCEYEVTVIIPDDRARRIKLYNGGNCMTTKNKDHKIASEILFHLSLETSESVEYTPCAFNFQLYGN